MPMSHMYDKSSTTVDDLVRSMVFFKLAKSGVIVSLGFLGSNLPGRPEKAKQLLPIIFL